jgi:hypothetical protein
MKRNGLLAVALEGKQHTKETLMVTQRYKVSHTNLKLINPTGIEESMSCKWLVPQHK